MKIENKIRYKHKYKRYMWQLGALSLAQEHIFPHIYIYALSEKG